MAEDTRYERFRTVTASATGGQAHLDWLEEQGLSEAFDAWLGEQELAQAQAAADAAAAALAEKQGQAASRASEGSVTTEALTPSS